VLLVHGEYERGMRCFANVLASRGLATRMPRMGEPITLD
jgi:metallo-beta-lactamase family protein